ncbi:hypothetical protein FSP39_008647 [Pinctada imbricata]|uniref:Uncharacterized protein n=1 Tax=Pinctada imbricata TaxID=66713 RepID=A0AA89C5N4_PINIB|nr:hypothetical protein FSP39_008647 [Pinctada imbricata]
MGEKGKKRKTDSNSTYNESDLNDVSTGQDNTVCTSFVGKVINALSTANRVIYGENSETPRTPVSQTVTPTFHPEGQSEGPTTSTPKNQNQEAGRTVQRNDDVINKKLDTILQKLSKLDDLESKFSDIQASVQNMDCRVKNMEQKSKDFEKSLDFVAAEVDDLKAQKYNDITMGPKDENLDGLYDELEKLRAENSEMKRSIEDLQCRSMKNNLIFTGIEELNYENTEESLKDFIYYELQIDRNIEFGNVHRFGRSFRGKPRPIVARFLFYKDLVEVKNSANRLRGSRFGISEQYPTQVEERRKNLYPVMKRLKQEGNRVKLVRDRLYVNGQNYHEGDDVYYDNDVRTSHDNRYRRQQAQRRQRTSESVPQERYQRPVPSAPPAPSVITSSQTEASRRMSVGESEARIPTPQTVS